MKHLLSKFLPVALLAVTCTATAADDFTLEDGYTSLFNGKDLTGWKYGDVPPKKKLPTEVLDGKTESSDNRFEAKDGFIVANIGKGPNMAVYTAKEFNKDFHLKREFRAWTVRPAKNCIERGWGRRATPPRLPATAISS